MDSNALPQVSVFISFFVFMSGSKVYAKIRRVFISTCRTDSIITTGPDKGAHYHELFLRGKLFLARRIKRATKNTTTPVIMEEPNFYQMTFLPQTKESIQSPPPEANDKSPGDTQITGPQSTAGIPTLQSLLVSTTASPTRNASHILPYSRLARSYIPTYMRSPVAPVALQNLRLPFSSRSLQRSPQQSTWMNAINQEVTGNNATESSRPPGDNTQTECFPSFYRQNSETSASGNPLVPCPNDYSHPTMSLQRGNDNSALVRERGQTMHLALRYQQSLLHNPTTGHNLYAVQLPYATTTLAASRNRAPLPIARTQNLQLHHPLLPPPNAAVNASQEHPNNPDGPRSDYA